MRPAPLTGSGVGGLLLLPWAAVTVGVVLRLSFDDELRFDACGRKEPAHTSCSGDGQGPAGAARCRWGPSSSVPPAAGAPGNHGAAAAAGHWGSKAPTNIKRLDFTKLNIIKYLLLNACYAGKGTAAFPAGGSSRFPKGTGHAPSQHNPSVQRPAPRHLLVLGTLGTLGTLGMPGVAALAPGCWGYPMADSSSGSVFTTTSCFTPAQPFPGEEKAKFGFSGCESSWWPSNAATCSMVLGWARRGQNLPQGEWSPPAPPSPGQRPPQQLLAAQRGSSPTKPPSKLGPGGSRHGQPARGSHSSPAPWGPGTPLRPSPWGSPANGFCSGSIAGGLGVPRDGTAASSHAAPCERLQRDPRQKSPSVPKRPQNASGEAAPLTAGGARAQGGSGDLQAAPPAG